MRLKGVLTAAEQHLVRTLVPEKGRDLLKEVRTHLIEIARPTFLEAMVEGIVDVKVLSLHHDINTVTGEEIVLFSLAESPKFREPQEPLAVLGRFSEGLCIFSGCEWFPDCHPRFRVLW